MAGVDGCHTPCEHCSVLWWRANCKWGGEGMAAAAAEGVRREPVGSFRESEAC